MNLKQVRKARLSPARVVTVSFGLVAALAPSLVSGQTPPPMSPELTPPAGNVVFLSTRGVGTQSYICLPPTSAGGANVWMFQGPQATLSINSSRFNQQIATHFLSPALVDAPTSQPGCTPSFDGKQLYCPTWQSSFDSSAVWGSPVGTVTAGSDPACPNTGAIPCLLLKPVASRASTLGNGLFTRVTYIQRLNTTGGSTPAGSCKVGARVLVPYSADYLFLTEDRKSDNDSGH